MELSLTITTKSADTVGNLAAIAALLDAYDTWNMGGDYSGEAFSAERVLSAVWSVTEAAGDLFRNQDDLTWGMSLDIDLSLGLFGRSLISLGTYLTGHPRFIAAYEKSQRDQAEFRAAHPELADPSETPALDP